MSEFISVADVSSLPPGTGRSVYVHGREFAIWNLDGQFYCIDDQCPHRGGPLGAGTLERCEVFCPLHGWGFDVRTGECSTRPDRPVATHPTRVVDGQVQILISSRAFAKSDGKSPIPRNDTPLTTDDAQPTTDES